MKLLFLTNLYDSSIGRKFEKVLITFQTLTLGWDNFDCFKMLKVFGTFFFVFLFWEIFKQKKKRKGKMFILLEKMFFRIQ